MLSNQAIVLWTMATIRSIKARIIQTTNTTKANITTSTKISMQGTMRGEINREVTTDRDKDIIKEVDKIGIKE
jgi:hypothetical protein